MASIPRGARPGWTRSRCSNGAEHSAVPPPEAFSRHAGERDLSSVLVVCPGIAAVTALDVSRRFRPTIAMLSTASTRSWWALTAPAVAVVLWSVLAYLVVWAFVLVRVAMDAGAGPTDWWVFPEVVGPLVAAASVGLVAGRGLSARWAAPVAAVAVIAGAVLASPWGRGPFEAGTTFGTMTGVERPPLRALAAIVASLAVAGGAVLAAREQSRAGRPRRPLLAAAAVTAVAAVVVPAAWPWDQDVYEFTREPFACTGQAPTVCGPRSRLPILQPLQATLANAYRTLEGTVFTRPTTFTVTRYGHYAHLRGSAPLVFDPAHLHDGRYDVDAVARVLVEPHPCSELFEAKTAGPILEGQAVVLEWLAVALRHQVPARPVPPDVLAGFEPTLRCVPMTGNWR